MAGLVKGQEPFMPTALPVTVMKSTSQHVTMTQNTFECTHSRDAGVTCSSKGMLATRAIMTRVVYFSTALCSEGALRLVNGSSPSRELVPLTSCTDPSLH